MRDYYQIIGVRPDATDTEIKQSFRKLAVLYHPDKNASIEAEEKFKEVNEAYEVLSDPARRAQYDLLISGLNVTVRASDRDPAYRRRKRPFQSQREDVQSTTELMAEYLPKFRWVCWVSLLVCLLVVVDFLLPFRKLEEDILEINRMYRTGRGGGMIYDHDELITRNGTSIKLYDDELLYFKEVRHIDIEKSILFGKIVTVSTPDEKYKVRVASIYNHLFFIPMILFVTSLLGVSLRKSIEFPFNLSIVSFLLLIVVIFILFK